VRIPQEAQIYKALNVNAGDMYSYTGVWRDKTDDYETDKDE
jgi:hypothetical protein